MIRYKYTIQGTVQGVGFRPFIYRLATELNLNGFVLNNSQGVEIELEGKVKNITLFEERLKKELPPLAHIDSFEKDPMASQNSSKFEIIQTVLNSTKTTLISPDIKICKNCIEDILNTNKYKNYFATNCTNCGPRYSIIKTVPYDRANTSMDQFTMCQSCQKEYSDPTNRRYHAQPISCNTCGPKIQLYEKGNPKKTQTLYQDIANLIKKGEILAIKGMGGFHIVCDSSNEHAIAKLREHKSRPKKPFAIMCKNMSQINSLAFSSNKEEQILCSKEAPIVILDKKNNKNISNLVAPDIDRIGCFLPTTALHYLLFEELKNPIIATSANLGGEPIITKKEDIEKKLPFISYIVDFDREIINAVDDSLLQVIDGKINMLRLARGYAPKVIKLPFSINTKLLAVGANAKSTISIAFNDTIILGPHIGDLDSLVAFEYFLRTIKTFENFYDFKPEVILHDLHPNYETTKWALNQNIKTLEIQHHLAHIYALKAEHDLQDKSYIGFSFDGTGYGTDDTLWGGEIFNDDKRIYRFKHIKLLGGAKAIKEPRRIALGILFEHFSLQELLELDHPTINSFSTSELKLLYQSYQKNINCFVTSSVGRLFDAIASFGDMIQTISYEGQSGLLIESFYDDTINDTFEYAIENGIIDIKFIDHIFNTQLSQKELASMLINTLHAIILEISTNYNCDIYLTGGVFQNKTLLKKVICSLKEEKKDFYTNNTIPTNDGGISLGQIYKATLDLKAK